MPGPIPVNCSTGSGESIILSLYAESDNENALIKCSEAEALENGEAPVQLLEGHSYEYELPPNYVFEGNLDIVRPSRRNPSAGRITPGIFVGTLSLNILERQDGLKVGIASLEVRSVKAKYRDEYRFMLEEISKKCTDLLMQHSSPVTQSFEADFAKDSKTIYQRFAFVKSVLESSEFKEALHRIMSAPVTTWAHIDEETDIRRIGKIGSAQIRQMASRSNRINLPVSHPLEDRFKTIPARLSVTRKTETLDTPENRFVKYALEVFYRFCTEVRHSLEKDNGENPRACKEAALLEKWLGNVLNQGLFKEISPPSSLPLNSPVLQRKEGYREVLRVWLMFDLAARLVWRGGEDVYKAGKRDVAILYEYWLFFKLLEIFNGIFKIEPSSVEKLIEATGDGIGLKLKSGIGLCLDGEYSAAGRNLKVQFSYNRTFLGSRPYPEKGSWSRHMRPDYTLSVWPSEFTEDEAEKQEVMVHIHFDAKYKVEGLGDIMGDEGENLDSEKLEQRMGTYKRADLLKMHAYKDAIRRTGGAYVLYPGNDKAAMKGFHEIIPGLGVFAVRPSQSEDGSVELTAFIREVIGHLLDRASQREHHTYHTYDVHKNKKDFEVREVMPESYGSERTAPPAETFVSIGFCRGDAHYDWIKKTGLYNFRADSVRGSLRLTPAQAGARYLLLHKEGNLVTDDIWEILEIGPRIFSKEALIKEGYYKEPSAETYLVYKVKQCSGSDFAGSTWDVSKLAGYTTGRGSGLPFTVTLAGLMKAKVK